MHKIESRLEAFSAAGPRVHRGSARAAAAEGTSGRDLLEADLSQLKINLEESRETGEGRRKCWKKGEVPLDRRPVAIPSAPGLMTVPLTRGRFAVIDAADAEAVGRHRWHANEAPVGPGRFYAVARVDGRDCKLHRFLWRSWGLAPTELLDHKNGDSLDNRRENLRTATRSLNGANRAPSPNGCGYRGVTLDRGRYRAQIVVNGKHRRLGSFSSPQEAARAYEAAFSEAHPDECPARQAVAA